MLTHFEIICLHLLMSASRENSVIFILTGQIVLPLQSLQKKCIWDEWKLMEVVIVDASSSINHCKLCQTDPDGMTLFVINLITRSQP